MGADCGQCGHSDRPRKRPRLDDGVGSPAEEEQGPTQILGDAEVLSCSSVEAAASALARPDCVAAVARRPLRKDLARTIADYVCSCPRWPDVDHLHPLEASWDRVAIVDFSHVLAEHEDLLGTAIAYGAGLPSRFSENPASARTGIERVVSVLPQEIAAQVSQDAASLLLALRAATGRRQYVLKLELVQGDTCQKWHCDQNIQRSLVTYVGPGTICAHERGVTRSADGNVDAVNEDTVVQPEIGDFLLMKGGEWDGSAGHGTAHRAPPIGPKPECEPSRHRLVLKVDISHDF